MIRINLLSEHKKPKVAQLGKRTQDVIAGDPATVWLLGLLGVALIAGLAWYLMLNEKTNRLDAEIAEVQVEVDRLAPIIAEVEEFERKRADLEHKVSVINDLKARQGVPVRLMDIISRSLPERLWLTQVAQRGRRIQVQGRAFNNNAVAAFIDNLDQVPGMTEPVLRESRRGRSRRGGATVYEFSLDFRLETQPIEGQSDVQQAAAR